MDRGRLRNRQSLRVVRDKSIEGDRAMKGLPSSLLGAAAAGFWAPNKPWIKSAMKKRYLLCYPDCSIKNFAVSEERYW